MQNEQTPTPPEELSAGQRAAGQRAALFTQLMAASNNYIVAGPMMMLFATDVLDMSAKRIGAIVALMPLMSLLRLPLISHVRRLGKGRVMLASDILRTLMVVTLLLLPFNLLSFPLYVALLVFYSMCQQVGLGAIWQPLLRDITTNQDRGRFFARMRFWFTLVSSITIAAIAAFIGESISGPQYKILLLLATIGFINRIYWGRQIPEVPPENETERSETAGDSIKAFWKTIRTSPLMRLPVILVILFTFCNVPVYVVYLRKVLLIPSDVISLFTLFLSIGGVLTFFLWGRIADAIGFRSMLMGLLIIAILAAPLQLLLAPAGADIGFADRDLMTHGVLMLIGLITGAVMAGIGIAMTSIQHYYTSSRDSLEAMNIYQILVTASLSAVSIWGGFLIEDIALPNGTHPIGGGLAYFDWFKAYLVIVVPILQLTMLFLAARLPDARTDFGISDFFGALTGNPLQSMVRQRNVYHRDEEKRIQLAQWLGRRPNPINIESLLSLIDDPSYDVKIEAIRALARTRSPEVAERMLEILRDPDRQHLADEVAWALGELEWQPAVDALIERLDARWRPGIRAMSARALGKIGDEHAIAPLAEMVATERQSLHALSSACRALLRLNAQGQAHLIFQALVHLQHRADCFELLDVLCHMLDISNEWLLRATPNTSPRESLLAYIELQPASWQTEKHSIVQILRNKNLKALEKRCSEAMQKKTKSHPLVRDLMSSLHNIEQWQPLAVLAAAWLLNLEAS